MLLLFACATPDAPDTPGATADTNTDSAPVESTPTLQFRYVVLADPHIYAPTGDNVDRLDRAVAWITTNAELLDLRLVLIVGDIAWGEGMDAAFTSLNALTIIWVPINGDNEIASDSEQAYDVTFAEHYAALSTQLDDWEMGPTEVWNPEWQRTSWFHNVAFTFEGIRFVGLDWASRDENVILSEMGALHDFEGGTFPFFEDQLTRAAGLAENVVMFSHIPMHLSPGGFDLPKLARISAVTYPRADHVWADLAGHYHGNGSETVEGAGYDLHVTDATWDDDVQLRLVEVWANEVRFEPSTETVVIP